MCNLDLFCLLDSIISSFDLCIFGRSTVTKLALHVGWNKALELISKIKQTLFTLSYLPVESLNLCRIKELQYIIFCEILPRYVFFLVP